MCSNFHIKSFVSLRANIRRARNESASRVLDKLFWNLNTSNIVMTRSIGSKVVGPQVTFRHAGNIDSVTCTWVARGFHIESSGAVSLQPRSEVVVVLRFKIEPGS
jgi:hypothetical protein